MKHKYLKLLLLAVVVFEGAFLLLSKNTADKAVKEPLSEQQVRLLAADVLAICKDSKYHPTCYEEEIPKLMESISMEDAFRVTRAVQGEDASFPYCHVLGHELSAREVSRDPANWKDVVSRCPSGMCSNGCIHGGFQERFRAESLTDEQVLAIKPELMTLCEKRSNWNPTGLEQASCYHALGHLTMYLTLADIDKAIVLCEELTIKADGRDFSRLCYDGVFMQVFQPLEPEDFALIKGKEVTRDQVGSFCGEHSGAKKGSCLSESWPLFREELMSDPKNLVSFCAKEDANEQDRCYSALFYVLTAQFQFDSDRITDYCAGLSGQRRAQCFANAASRLIETDYRNINASVAICKKADTHGAGNTCYQELVMYSTYNFHAGSLEATSLCDALPEQWKTACLTKN